MNNEYNNLLDESPDKTTLKPQPLFFYIGVFWNIISYGPIAQIDIAMGFLSALMSSVVVWKYDTHQTFKYQVLFLFIALLIIYLVSYAFAE